jgi:hypothetical protein
VQQVLTHSLTCGPELLTHAILDSKLDAKMLKSPADEFLAKFTPEEQANVLNTVLQHVTATAKLVDTLRTDTKMPGFIKCKRKKETKSSADTPPVVEAPEVDGKAKVDPTLLYEDFYPLQLHQHELKADEDPALLLELPSFSAAVDEFYSRMEVQRQAQVGTRA